MFGSDYKGGITINYNDGHAHRLRIEEENKMGITLNIVELVPSFLIPCSALISLTLLPAVTYVFHSYFSVSIGFFFTAESFNLSSQSSILGPLLDFTL